MLFWPLSFPVPEWLAENVELLDDPSYLRCAGKRWSLDYAWYNTVFTYSFLHHPLQPLYGFDFVAKCDMDIRWLVTPPLNPMADMATRGCAYGHTIIHRSHEDCDAGAFEALMRYSDTTGIIPKSSQYEWCQDYKFHFYGNMQFFWCGWFRSPEMLNFTDYLFNVEHGYIQRRWGDQAVIPKMLCLSYNISDIFDNAAVCDYTYLRNEQYFEHI